MRAIDVRVTQLHALLMAHPEGVSWPQIAAYIGTSHHETNAVIRAFRIAFSQQQVNLTADPQGHREKWLYRLDGHSEAWAANRIADTESRLETMHAMARTLVNTTSGRTLAGRKARKIEIALRHLQEDLGELVVEGSLRL